MSMTLFVSKDLALSYKKGSLLQKVLRDPYHQMLSSFNYFHNLDFLAKLPMDAPGLKEFFNDTRPFYKKSSPITQNRKRGSNDMIMVFVNFHICPDLHSFWSKHLIKNSNFFDMGYSYTLTNKTKIETFVDQIMDFYSLIMITEYMEESLILMAYELNWNIEDVRFFSGSWIYIIKFNRLIPHSRKLLRSCEDFFLKVTFSVIMSLYIIRISA